MLWKHEAVGSNPTSLTNFEDVRGSNPSIPTIYAGRGIARGAILYLSPAPVSMTVDIPTVESLTPHEPESIIASGGVLAAVSTSVGA